MVINTESIDLLIQILEKDYFDETLFKDFTKTKGIKEFINHQDVIGKTKDRVQIKEELKKLILNNTYYDKYEFYKLRNNLEQLRLDIQFIKWNSHIIVKEALEKVYKIVPKEIPIRANIYLYAGGIDGGFTINRKEIFINYGKYIGQRKEFIKILSHEMYHSRAFPIESRIIYSFKILSKKNRFLYDIIGRTIEEGIACLVQHGPIIEKDDLTGNLTKRQLLLAKDEFKLMNNYLIKIKSSKTDDENSVHINIYVIGYLIVSLIYKEKGVLVLDDWTINLNFRRIIKEYVELCNRNQIPSGFKPEILQWII